MIKRCALCTDDVTNENLNEDGNYFCTNKCEMEYSEMSLGNRRLVKKVREISERKGMYMHFDNFKQYRL